MTKPELEVDIQFALAFGSEECDTEASDSEEPPSPEILTEWAKIAFSEVAESQSRAAEVTLRIVGEDEMRTLNSQYRSKNKPTNVLSFAFENEFSEVIEIDTGLLGDVVICHQVVVSEAQQQSKSVYDHYAHMVTHGILHLCGYDHQVDEDAERMELIEAKILSLSDIENPYCESETLDTTKTESDVSTLKSQTLV